MAIQTKAKASKPLNGFKSSLSNIGLIAALGIGFTTISIPVTYAKTQRPTYSDWPKIESAIKTNPAHEKKIKEIVSQMSLRQKIGQMIQPEIKKITPDEVRQYYIGSVLNGGGSWPQMNKHATVKDWLKLADAYWDASMSTDLKTPIPVIWGIDAVHGNNNVYGATIYPHNIGLGAAHNPELVGKIGQATGKAVRAIGVNWAFAPTLAVVQNQRWGRSYESFSADPYLVRAYGAKIVTGLQGDFSQDDDVAASAKHFLGDGGTMDGVNEGKNYAPLKELINKHGQGYYGALGAGAQTVMITYNSWDSPEAGTDSGKIHGVKQLVTGALRDKMGFDGFVISDWNGVGQVTGCTNAHCPQAINAGIDMIMVPDDWKEFIENTVKDVEEGRISEARINEAVTRILRVKMRMGLWENKPSKSKWAGDSAAIENRPLARDAVRQSIVLLKNNNSVLPLANNKKILVVGKAADDIPTQSGGWSITWQGDETTNADFPNATSFLKGIRANLGDAMVDYSPDGKGVDLKKYAAIVAVVGENPYAETKGDVRLPQTLDFTSRFKDQTDLVNSLSGKGVPLVTVLYSGRTLYANDLINKSDAFVAAFLPGTQADGVSDVLVKGKNQKDSFDFKGRLSFPWPATKCPPGINEEQGSYKPLFAMGYGLSYKQKSRLGQLKLDDRQNCPGN